MLALSIATWKFCLFSYFFLITDFGSDSCLSATNLLRDEYRVIQRCVILLQMNSSYYFFLSPEVNFINVKRANFTYERLFSSFVLALNELLYKKCAQKNVDEIEPSFQLFEIHFQIYAFRYWRNINIRIPTNIRINIVLWFVRRDFMNFRYP